MSTHPNAYKLTSNTKDYCGVTVTQIQYDNGDLGAWIEDTTSLPQDSRARTYPGAIILRGATIRGGAIRGGTIRGGTIEGGTIRGGAIRGGTIRGGLIEGGTIEGGTIRGGAIRGGTIRGGTIRGGTIRGGTIWGGTIEGGTIRGGGIEGGTIWGGTITRSPAMAQRSDGYCFIVHPVDGHLRVWAGCRNLSYDQAIWHWNDDHPHGEESRAIIEFLRGQLRFREDVQEEAA